MRRPRVTNKHCSCARRPKVTNKIIQAPITSKTGLGWIFQGVRKISTKIYINSKVLYVTNISFSHSHCCRSLEICCWGKKLDFPVIYMWYDITDILLSYKGDDAWKVRGCKYWEVWSERHLRFAAARMGERLWKKSPMAPGPFRGWRGGCKANRTTIWGRAARMGMGKRPQMQLGEGQPPITTRGT